MNPELEQFIRSNCPWRNLPDHVRKTLVRDEAEYKLRVLDFSIKNQLPWKNNLVRDILKSERDYYEQLLDYSSEHLMLFPYHLSQKIITGLRNTPFIYYSKMVENLLTAEKNYDALPNFTAADCLQLLGIGRNQYIDLINRCRPGTSKTSIFRRAFSGITKPAFDKLLPQQPMDNIFVEPWWEVKVAFVSDIAIQLCTPQEKALIDTMLDDTKRSFLAGEQPIPLLLSLHKRGLIYFHIPIADNDVIILGKTLEGFVMNRVQGDFMETMLYQIFVSIDERTTVAELAETLRQDVYWVKVAMAIYCRLGFARKKNVDLSVINLDETWTQQKNVNRSKSSLELSPSAKNLDALVQSNTGRDSETPSPGDCLESSLILSHSLHESLSESLADSIGSIKRIGVLYDSTLTAFLMMGNLSPSLKNHAVTMFEVGKLIDESLENLLCELDKVSSLNEGEAERYFTHAVELRDALRFLRHNPAITWHKEQTLPENIEKPPHSGHPVDLLRCESLLALDENTCARLLQKNYYCLLSLAPLGHDTQPPLSAASPPLLGPWLPEVTSLWFRLFIYSKTQSGPSSLLLSKGSRLTRVPAVFRNCDNVLLTSWSHDPAVVPIANLLLTLNDALTYSPIMIQSCAGDDKSDHVPFPLDAPTNESVDNDNSEEGMSNFLRNHPSVAKLEKVLDLTHSCGYLSFVRTSQAKAGSTETQRQYNQFVLLDCTFGLPLFLTSLSRQVRHRIESKCLLSENNLSEWVASCRRLTVELLNFVSEQQEESFADVNYDLLNGSSAGQQRGWCPLPSHSLLFDGERLKRWCEEDDTPVPPFC